QAAHLVPRGARGQAHDQAHVAAGAVPLARGVGSHPRPSGGRARKGPSLMMKTSILCVASAAILAFSACATDEHIRRAQEQGEAPRLELAETYVKKGAYDAAAPLLTHFVAEQPKNAYARTLYGTVLREKGLYPQAERELKAALHLDNESASA